MPVRDCERRLYPTEIPSDTGKMCNLHKERQLTKRTKPRKLQYTSQYYSYMYVWITFLQWLSIHPSIHTWVDALCFTLAPLHRSSSASMHSSYCSLRCAFEWLKTLVGLLCDRYSSPTLFLSFISITCSKAKVFLITSFKRQALRLLDIWIL